MANVGDTDLHDLTVRFTRGNNRESLIKKLKDRHIVAQTEFGHALTEVKVKEWLTRLEIKFGRRAMLKAFFMIGLMPGTAALSLACGDMVESILRGATTILSEESITQAAEKAGHELANKITSVLSQPIVNSMVRDTDHFFDQIGVHYNRVAQDLRENHFHKMSTAELLILYNFYNAEISTRTFFRDRIRSMLREYDLVSKCGYALNGGYRWVGVVQPPGGQAKKVAIFYKPGVEAKHVASVVAGGLIGLGLVCVVGKSRTYVEHVLENEMVKERAQSSKHWKTTVVSEFCVLPRCPWKPQGVQVRRINNI